MNTLHLLTPIALTVSAALLPAQSVTSPRGLDTTEGNTSFLHFTSSRIYQQIDNTHRGSQFAVRSLGWRRNGTGSGGGTNAPARTFDLEVRMDQVSMAKLSRVIAQNWRNPTVVFARRTVNFPDWTGLNGSPSPFDFSVTLDAPFPYLGNDALLICFDYTNNSATSGVNVDRDFTGASTSTSTALGTGCTVTGGTAPFLHGMRLENNGPGMPAYGMRIRVDGSRALAGANVFANLAFADSNLTVPGLCTTLHALPTITVDLGRSDPTGVLPECSLSFPHTPSAVGTTLVTQLLQLDPGQTSGIPVALSNGRRAVMPSNASTVHECIYQWATLPDPDGTVIWGGGIVMQLGL